MMVSIALAAGLTVGGVVNGPDAPLEPSLLNEVEHALARAAACPGDPFGTNGLARAEIARRVVSAQGADGRWYVNGRDETRAAEAILRAVAGFPDPVAAVDPWACWRGIRVGVLGDSITDRRQLSSQRIYWDLLAERLGWDVGVFGISGHQWRHIPGQTDRMVGKMGANVDAIFILVGTNDYAGGVPLGRWYDEVPGEVNWFGRVRKLNRRALNRDPKTVRGRINIALEKVKRAYPRAQIVLLTPLHRAFFQCSPTNIQPSEDWPNPLGLYLEDYVNCTIEAGRIWSCPVIDLYAESTLTPMVPEFKGLFRSAAKDGLHPSSEGHRRMAELIYRRLPGLPVFR